MGIFHQQEPIYNIFGKTFMKQHMHQATKVKIRKLLTAVTFALITTANSLMCVAQLKHWLIICVSKNVTGFGSRNIYDALYSKWYKLQSLMWNILAWCEKDISSTNG